MFFVSKGQVHMTLHCHRVKTQLQLINIIIIIMTDQGPVPGNGSF